MSSVQNIKSEKLKTKINLNWFVYIKSGLRRIQVGVPVLLFIYYWGSAFKIRNDYHSKTS